jgi:SAM-dependent methyltransferase
MARLRTRKLSLWSRDYLSQRALWPAIEQAVARAFDGRERAGLVVIDVGCGAMPYADLFSGARLVGVDHSRDDATPDLLADVLQLPLASACADLVFCSQVIEHVTDPVRLLAECARLLRPGGALVLSAPFYWPLHELPHDYFRFTPQGLDHLLRSHGLQVLSLHADCGTLTQVAVSVIHLLPRWARPLHWLINLLTPVLQRLSADRLCALNVVAVALRR